MRYDVSAQWTLKRVVDVAVFDLVDDLNHGNGQIWYFSPMDLQRVAAEKAAAVLVLCNKFSSDPCEDHHHHVHHDDDELDDENEPKWPWQWSWQGLCIPIKSNSSILIYPLCFYLISSMLYLVHSFLIHCKSFISSLTPEYNESHLVIFWW